MVVSVCIGVSFLQIIITLPKKKNQKNKTKKKSFEGFVVSKEVNSIFNKCQTVAVLNFQPTSVLPAWN